MATPGLPSFAGLSPIARIGRAKRSGWPRLSWRRPRKTGTAGRQIAVPRASLPSRRLGKWRRRLALCHGEPVGRGGGAGLLHAWVAGFGRTGLREHRQILERVRNAIQAGQSRFGRIAHGKVQSFYGDI